MPNRIVSEFEWNVNKDVSNRQKHGISFEEAIKIFDGPRLIIPSKCATEMRWLTIGRMSNRVITVIYTERLGLMRIISARAARAREREQFEEILRTSALDEFEEAVT